MSILTRFEESPGPARVIGAIRRLTSTRKNASPDKVFHAHDYLLHNERRLEHLAALNLQICGSRVLEVGAGIGDHTDFYLGRDCQVVATEPREANRTLLSARYPGLDVRYLDLDRPDPDFDRDFDIVHCYGVLYHLSEPAAAIEFMSLRAGKMLLLETCVDPGEDQFVKKVAERKGSPSQAVSGWGCRPTRRWVYEALKQHFEFVYLPKTQPRHHQFPLDWEKVDLRDGQLARAVFIGSRHELPSDLLLDHIPTKQTVC